MPKIWSYIALELLEPYCLQVSKLIYAFFLELLNSLATDGSHSLLTGTARHGLVRLWDMRDTSAHVAHYYVGHPYLGQSSPVYSVAFDQVWPITKIFSLFPFCVKKIIYLPGGQINDPS